MYKQNNANNLGSKIDRGEKCYVKKTFDNFFKQISTDTYRDIKSGDGNGPGDGIDPGKIQALHSSFALTANVFDYWRNPDNNSCIVKALLISFINIINISFEKKFPILKDANKPPNIDIIFEYRNGDCCVIDRFRLIYLYYNIFDEEERYYMDQLETKFPNDMIIIYNTAKKELNYNASRFWCICQAKIPPRILLDYHKH